MTKDELQKVDRLVAEKVMGWREILVSNLSPKEPHEAWWCDETSAGRKIRVRNFSPTTRPEHCRMVEDKMVADGWQEHNTTLLHGGTHIARFERYGDAPGRGKAIKTDRNLAVCLAALKAVGVEVDDGHR